ncbi:MAG: TMEM175 family protein, partial [Actinomycetes bacterium]
MTQLDGTEPRRGLFGKTRMEAFSDGVYAIAITLLVLDIAVKPGGTPLQELFSAWPTYVGYVVSFLTIGAAWIAHTALTDELVRVDPVFLRLNLLLLLFVVFLPFPTTLITEAFGDREAERVAATAYGLTLLMILLLTMALDRYALR